jgi:hypothetical protein
LAAPSSRDLFDRPWPVLGIFALLSCGMTFPLVFNLTTALPHGSGDLWQNYWNFWWWKKAFFDLHVSPFHSEYLFHPFGVDLIFHTHSPFNMLAAMPANLLWGGAAAYNLCVLAALTLSGLGTWLLVREWTGNGRAAFLGGLIFAYFPQHIEQTFEHLNLFSTEFLPWALYYLLRVCRGSGTGAIVGLGLTFAGNALCSWHLGLKLLLTVIPLAGIELYNSRGRRLRIVRNLALAATIAAGALLPAVQPMLSEIAAGATYYAKPAVDRGIDPTYLLTPQFGHPLWGGLVVGRYIERAYQASGFICYLGFVPLALAGLAVARRRRGWRLWLGYSVVTLILALGAHPFWNGTLIESVTLPFGWLADLPVFNLLRVANRYMILTSLGLAVLAGMGFAALGRTSNRMFYGLAALICFEYAWLPYPLQKVEFPDAYREMLAGPILRIGAVLDIPWFERNRSVHNMVMQTLHERPIAGGYLSTFPPEPLEAVADEPALADLAGIPKLARPIDAARLIHLGFDTVVLHKYRADSYGKRKVAETPREDLLARKEALRMGGIPDEKMDEIRRQLTEICGPPAFEDDLVAIFYLPAAFGRR